MMPGRYKAEIVRNGVTTLGDKVCAKIKFAINGEEVFATIWLTDKAKGMARAQLKKCGFDVDSVPLEALSDKPDFLKGNEVDIVVEDNGQYGLQANILTNDVSKKQLADLTQMLRSAKKSGEAEVASSEKYDLPF